MVGSSGDRRWNLGLVMLGEGIQYMPFFFFFFLAWGKVLPGKLKREVYHRLQSFHTYFLFF